MNSIANSITLTHENFKAEFLPEMGMALKSFTDGSTEAIAQSTAAEFTQTRAGLGVLIGPHFLSRPLLKEKLKENDPYLHGIARYAPWNFEHGTTWIHARLTGKDTLNGKPLAELEGQDFEISYKAHLDKEGLHSKLSIVSETDSLVGAHFYYNLPEGKGIVSSKIKPVCLDQGEAIPVNPEWLEKDSEHNLSFDLQNETDYSFYPYPNPLEGTIQLDTQTHTLHVRYKSPSAENCWQLWHPKGADFVCIEPISSQNPRKPNLTVSQLEISLIMNKKI